MTCGSGRSRPCAEEVTDGIEVSPDHREDHAQRSPQEQRRKEGLLMAQTGGVFPALTDRVKKTPKVTPLPLKKILAPKKGR